jgi:type II secretory pathway pseudopilin PulG
MVELLVVLAIIAVVVAITFPIWGSAKISARERQTESALHQTWLALEIYRQDYDSAADFGTSSQLGLPNALSFVTTWIKVGQWWTAPGKFGYGPLYYPRDPSDSTFMGSPQFRQNLENWTDYSTKNGSSAVILGDFNHTEGCSKYPLNFDCEYKGFGVTLAGSLSRKSALGDINAPIWWDQ